MLTVRNKINYSTYKSNRLVLFLNPCKTFVQKILKILTEKGSWKKSNTENIKKTMFQYFYEELYSGPTILLTCVLP